MASKQGKFKRNLFEYWISKEYWMKLYIKLNGAYLKVLWKSTGVQTNKPATN